MAAHTKTRLPDARGKCAVQIHRTQLRPHQHLTEHAQPLSGDQARRTVGASTFVLMCDDPAGKGRLTAVGTQNTDSFLDYYVSIIALFSR